jgi:hypothetical protein
MLASFSELLSGLTWWQHVLLGVGLFAVTAAISLAEVAFILVKLPPNYFCDNCARAWWADGAPWLRWLGIITKNVLGLLHVVIGILLSLPGIPGQGILTILVGVMLMDIPGMRRLERRIVSMPKVQSAINRLRARYGRPPLVVEEPQDDSPGEPRE